MPYTNVWSNTRPAGSVAAKNIDDELRALRVDIQDRVEDTLFVDFTADPLVLKDSIKGLKNDLIKLVPFSKFINDMHAKENDIDGTLGRVQGFCGANPWIAAVELPPGCTITKIEYLIDKHDATSVSCRLAHVAFVDTTPTSVQDDLTSVAAAGLHIVASADLTVTLDPDAYYYIHLFGVGPAGNGYYIYAARITFNRPSVDNAT